MFREYFRLQEIYDVVADYIGFIAGEKRPHFRRFCS